MLYKQLTYNTMDYFEEIDDSEQEDEEKENLI
jgi:hypothetical protein